MREIATKKKPVFVQANFNSGQGHVLHYITSFCVVIRLSTLYFWLAGKTETKQVVNRMSKWVEGGGSWKGQESGQAVFIFLAASPLVLTRFAREFAGYAAPAPGSTKPLCYAGYNMHGTDPLNVRLAGKIRFGQSKFRTRHALYNLPSKKKENLLFKLANSLVIFHTITSLWVVFDHYCWSKFVASGTINELDFYCLQMHFQKSSQSQLIRGHLADS